MQVKPIRNDADLDETLREFEQLWGAAAGTPDGDRLDVLTSLAEACEREHFPIDPPESKHA
jgi:HTH-type transcriptional regulator / antitoxin HigA